jgi:hypothetical protein
MKELFTFCNGPGQIHVIQCQVAGGRVRMNTKHMRIISSVSVLCSLSIFVRDAKKESFL